MSSATISGTVGTIIDGYTASVDSLSDYYLNALFYYSRIVASPIIKMSLKFKIQKDKMAANIKERCRHTATNI